MHPWGHFSSVGHKEHLCPSFSFWKTSWCLVGPNTEARQELGPLWLEEGSTDVTRGRSWRAGQLRRPSGLGTGYLSGCAVPVSPSSDVASPSLCVRPSQCGRHQGILRLVCSFIERTFTATPFHARGAAELGHLFVLRDQVKEASMWYSEAMNLDENSVAALTGLRRPGRAAGGSGRVGSHVGSEREVWASILPSRCVSLGVHWMAGYPSMNLQA